MARAVHFVDIESPPAVSRLHIDASAPRCGAYPSGVVYPVGACRAPPGATAPRDRRAGDRVGLGELAWAGVPCWTGRADRWARFTVPVAYDLRYDTHVRPVMLVTTKSAAQRFWPSLRPEHATPSTPPGAAAGPPTSRLAADTGLSVRTVQRADTALRLLGVATEVLRGRQRTRVERLASWAGAIAAAAGPRCGPCTTTPSSPAWSERCHPIPKGLP